METVEGFFQISDKLILDLGFNNNVVNIGFDIAMQLVGKTELYHLVVGGSRILDSRKALRL